MMDISSLLDKVKKLNISIMSIYAPEIVSDTHQLMKRDVRLISKLAVKREFRTDFLEFSKKYSREIRKSKIRLIDALKEWDRFSRVADNFNSEKASDLFDELEESLLKTKQSLADFLRNNWTPKDLS